MKYCWPEEMGQVGRGKRSFERRYVPDVVTPKKSSRGPDSLPDLSRPRLGRIHSLPMHTSMLPLLARPFCIIKNLLLWAVTKKEHCQRVCSDISSSTAISGRMQARCWHNCVHVGPVSCHLRDELLLLHVYAFTKGFTHQSISPLLFVNDERIATIIIL
jgi:hypothetical protein